MLRKWVEQSGKLKEIGMRDRRQILTIFSHIIVCLFPMIGESEASEATGSPVYLHVFMWVIILLVS